MRLIDPRTLLLPSAHELLDLLELLPRVDGAHVGVLVQRVADSQRAHAPLSLRMTSSYTDSWTSRREPAAADVPLVEVDAVDDPLDRLIERRVVEDHVRSLAAELERELLVGADIWRRIALPSPWSR